MTQEALAAMGWKAVCDELPGTDTGPAYTKNGIFATFYKPNQIHLTASVSGTMVLLQIGPIPFPECRDFEKFEAQMLMAKMGAEMMLGGGK